MAVLKLLNAFDRLILPLASLLFGIGLVSFAPARLVSQEPSPWKMEALLLRNGARIEGLLLEETEQGYRFRQVLRKSGSPTITGTEDYGRNEVASIERLGAADREELKRKLADLDRQRQLFLASIKQLDSTSEKSTIEGLKLRPRDWMGRKDRPGWEFQSQFFELQTDAREPIAALMALQLEEVFRAISRLIPSRIAGKPTLIQVWSNRNEFLEAVSQRSPSLAHPALFDAGANRILVGTELARIEKESQAIRTHHQSQIQGLNQRELEIARAFGGKLTQEYQDLFRRMRREVRDAEIQNDSMVRKGRNHLMQVLNHEAIHAYLVNWVFSPTSQPLPRWLNEGLAQVYETAFIEAGELRANWPDPIRLAAVRTLLKEGRFPALGRILTGTPDHFLARSTAKQDEILASSEAYLASWMLTYYLVFEKRLIPGNSLDAYLSRLAKEGNPLEAFEAWTGEPVRVFEPKWRAWIQSVKPDGSVDRAAPKSP